MTYSLNYPKGLRFSSICSDRPSTRQKQAKSTENVSISLVTFVKPDFQVGFNDAIKNITNVEYSFQPSPRLHLTLLNLFNPENRPYDPYYLRLTCECIKNFFKAYGPVSIKVKFNLIRPGSWFDKGKEKRKLSDGTVIAMVDSNDFNTKKFKRISNKLAVNLRSNLPGIFDSSLKPKFPTVWCTLGFFDRKDFEISQPLWNTFEALKHFRQTVRVDELAVVEFRKKSLSDGKILYLQIL